MEHRRRPRLVQPAVCGKSAAIRDHLSPGPFATHASPPAPQAHLQRLMCLWACWWHMRGWGGAQPQCPLLASALLCLLQDSALLLLRWSCPALRRSRWSRPAPRYGKKTLGGGYPPWRPPKLPDPSWPPKLPAPPWPPESPDPPWPPKLPAPPWPPESPDPPWLPEWALPWRPPARATGPLRPPERPPPLPFRCYTARDTSIGRGGGVMSQFVSLCLVFPCPYLVFLSSLVN